MKKIKKIVIFLGYKCNNNCLFCINADKRSYKNKNTDEVIKEIYKAKKENADIIEFIGGEATIRDDFLRIIKTAKNIGIKDIVIATNGRMFSNLEFAKKAVDNGLSAIIFSIHGHNAKAHDALTQSLGSFEQLVEGIKNLRSLGFDNINGNTTVVKQNYRHIPDIANLYVKYNVRNVEYIFVDPCYGGAYNNFHKLVPKISLASKFMKKALDIGNKYEYHQWKVRYVPLCYFKDYLDQISEINERILFDTKHWAPDFIDNDVIRGRTVYARIKTKRCKGCKLYDICEGIWKEYIKHYGDKELKKVI